MNYYIKNFLFIIYIRKIMDKVKKTEDIKAYMKQWRQQNKDKTKKHMQDFTKKHKAETLMKNTIKKLNHETKKYIELRDNIWNDKNDGLEYDEKLLESIINTITCLQKQIDNILVEYIAI
jgi:hypothetical protein